MEGNKYSYDLAIKTPVGRMTNHMEGEWCEDDILRGTSKNGMSKFKFEAERGQF